MTIFKWSLHCICIDYLPCFSSPLHFPLPGPPGRLPLLLLELLEPAVMLSCHTCPSALPLPPFPVSSLYASSPCWICYISVLYKLSFICMEELENNPNFIPVTLFSISGIGFLLFDRRHRWFWNICICDYIAFPSHNVLYLQFGFFLFLGRHCHKLTHILINN